MWQRLFDENFVLSFIFVGQSSILKGFNRIKLLLVSVLNCPATRRHRGCQYFHYTNKIFHGEASSTFAISEFKIIFHRFYFLKKVTFRRKRARIKKNASRKIVRKSIELSEAVEKQPQPISSPRTILNSKAPINVIISRLLIRTAPGIQNPKIRKPPTISSSQGSTIAVKLMSTSGRI